LTQEQTWILHTLFGLLPSLVFYFLFPPLLLLFAVFITGFALGRERRDHEIKTKIRAADWYKGWNIEDWSKDGKMDLVTFIVFPWWFYIVSILPL
jgi:hypothetical protein